MNKVVLIGRLTKDPDVRTAGETTVARYNLAVDRRYKKDGEQNADFIGCVAFGKNGEFVEKHLKKGSKIAVVGRIQTGSYEKDGQKIYTTDVVVEEHEFCEKKGDTDQSAPKQETQAQTDKNGFFSVDNGEEAGLPFL